MDTIPEVEGASEAAPSDWNPARDRAQDERYRLKNLVDQAVEQYKADRDLRSRYGKVLLWIFAVETAVAFLAMVLVGRDVLHLTQWEASSFFVVVFVQLAALVQTVVKGLFADHLHDLLNLIGRI